MRWFSRRVRTARAMRKHVQKILDHQRDILPPQSVTAVETSLAELQQAIQDGTPEQLDKAMQNLEATANKSLKPYPSPVWRENVEVLLVALTVAMAIRTFFLQPFKIPTGSMQPTLYGVMSTNLLGQNVSFPKGWQRVREWFAGVSYVNLVADTDGEVVVDPPLRLLIFNIKQTVWIGGKSHTLWFPPDYGTMDLQSRAGLSNRQYVHAGDEVIKLQVIAGDHLFVDRLSYNFRAPKRGEIIVFETKGIPEEYRDMYRIPGDQFYIKRLVGLGGETIQLGADRHLVINGTNRLDSRTPHFNRVYSFDPAEPAAESHYSGHVDRPELAQFFHSKPDGVNIPPGHYMVMGDNTLNSLDSRAWGYFPATNVIGKSFFVYWPISPRFGFNYQK